MNKQKTWQETESLIFCHQYENGVITPTDGDITICKYCNPNQTTGELEVDTLTRAYMQIYAPYRRDTARIKSAILTINAMSNGEKLGVYETDYSMQKLSPIVDYDSGKHNTDTGIMQYNFDITNLYWKQSRESESVYLAIKLVDENPQREDLCATIYRDDYYGKPYVTITYEEGENYSDTYTIGSIGQAKVDLVSGKLKIEMQDLAWGGNRMPFSLNRIFNLKEEWSNNSPGFMNVGKNWIINLFQTMYQSGDGYLYTDESGNIFSFENTDGKYVCTDDESMVYDPETKTMTRGDDKYLFNQNGSLVSITDKYNNSMVINYGENGKITSVVDGAGRTFNFFFDEFDCLVAVVAPDNSRIEYSTPDHYALTCITYPDKTKVLFDEYSITLTEADNTPVYKLEYQTDDFNCITSVSEYGAEDGEFELYKKTDYDYGFGLNKAVVTVTEGEDTTKTVYCFNSDAELISEYSCTEKDGNIIPADNVKGSTVNLLYNQSFEEKSFWKDTETDSVSAISLDSNHRYCQSKSIHFKENSQSGVYQQTEVLRDGEYTLSAYVKTTKARGVYLEITTPDNTLVAISEVLRGCDDFCRIELPFVLENASAVKVKIMPDGEGEAWADAIQLENGAVANEYNLLQNNNFEHDIYGWEFENAEITTNEKFNMTHSVRLDSNVTEVARVSQTVAVNTPKDMRETYTFSAWAKATAFENKERENCEAPVFRLKACILYDDMTTEEHTVDYAHGVGEWQYASVEFAKEQYKKVTDITVSCEYAYNAESCYFDDICLVRTMAETGLDSSNFENYDDTDKIPESETDSAPEFSEFVDSFGNPVTETTFTDGEFGTVYRSYGYSENGNDLVKETDGRGNVTLHEVDSITSRVKETTDRLGNKTAYEYDVSGKTTKVISKTAEGTELATVEYTYNALDSMTGIIRGDGLKYSLLYNAYGNLNSFGIVGMEKPLTAYTYNNGSGNVKEITYANGDSMKATYNSAGQMIAEKWYDKDENLVAHYKYMYDGDGNIVRSVDIFASKEYSYSYTDGNITRTNEYDITLNNDFIVTSKTLINSVHYVYSDGKLVKKRIVSAGGNEKTIYFENGDDATVAKFEVNGRVITSHSKNDSFGRKVFDELQTGAGFVSRQFDYHTGKITDEHKDGEKLKSTPTTQLVRKIIFSDGRTVEYEYDKEERITKVTDSIDGITEYTYDALGQLLTEAKNGIVLNRMVYDGYGNIIQKNDNNYVYDNVWKDKLVYYNGNAITYDEQGNPTNYLGHSLVWEKGRQLKSIDDISFTYNANGIRTSKTVDGIKHTYTLDGTKILREEWENNVLETIFDNEDDVCGIIYNNVPYYFVKNLQGDIIAITNSTGNIVARYSYDAWGKCTIEQDYSLNGSIATVNPYRYRGYYYDKETELYYLQSRYYDAEMGRFVNGDDHRFLGFTMTMPSYNLYTYCENDSVDFVDYFGHAPSLWTLTQMHNAVIVSAQSFLLLMGIITSSEVRTWNSRTKKYGRMDIYSYPFNTVWEVKRNNSSGIRLGKNQLKEYTSSYVYSLYNSWPRIKRTPRCGLMSVYGSVVVSNYLVTYHSYEGNKALILYDYMSLEKAAKILFDAAMATSAAFKTALTRSTKKVRDKVYSLLAQIKKVIGKAGKTTAKIISAIGNFLKKALPVILFIVGLIMLFYTGDTSVLSKATS